MSDAKILSVGLADIINGLPAELEKKNAELTALRTANEELAGALGNMVALAKPIFSDAPQRLAIEISEAALAKHKGDK